MKINLENVQAEKSDSSAGIFNEDIYERAKEKGLVVVLPRKNELQIDIDSDEQFATFNERIEWFTKNKLYLSYEDHFSKSGPPRRHITVKLWRDVACTEELNISDGMRVALQSLMGSDTKREMMNSLRVLFIDSCQRPPIIFFEKE